MVKQNLRNTKGGQVYIFHSFSCQAARQVLDKGLFKSQLFFTPGPKQTDSLQRFLEGEKYHVQHTLQLPSSCARGRALSGSFQLQNGRNRIAPTTEVSDILKMCWAIDFMLPCLRSQTEVDGQNDEAV